MTSLFAESIRQITLPSFYGASYAPIAKINLEQADREREAAIISAIKHVGYPISRGEICEATGLTTAVAQRMLTNMRRDGKLTMTGKRQLARWWVA